MLKPSAQRLDGASFKSFAALAGALAQASNEAGSERLAANAADVAEAKRVRKNRARRERYAASKA